MRPVHGIAIWLALFLPVAGDAQVGACEFRGAPDALAERSSPLDSLTIPLGASQAKLCYGRPSAGGRLMVGGEHPFGSPWPMGANESTTLHLPFPARLGTIDLEAGSYSLYAIPGDREWTVVVNGNASRWSEPITPDVRAADIGSVAVTPSVLARPVDPLTFRFEEAGPGEGTLVYEWERTRWEMPLTRR